jgi:hypothetical protein
MKPARTPIRTGAGRAGRAPRIFALAALVLSPLAAVIAASPPASAFTIPKSVDFISGGATLKGDGYSWFVSVDALNSLPGLVPPSIDVGLERLVGGSSNLEIHAWQFHATTSSFVFNSKTGALTLDSGKSLKPVLSVNVKFVPTKKTKEAGCAGTSSATVYTGKLTGSVDLVTGTKPKNLTLSSKKVSFTSGTNTLTVGLCIPDLCSGSAIWGEPSPNHSGAIAASGLTEYKSGKQMMLASVTRMTKLSAPKGATREDGAISASTLAKWSAATKTLSVSASGLVTGSGKLIGGASRTTTFPCQISGKGKKYTEHTKSYMNAKLSAWKAFVGHTVLTGTLTASSKGGGFFEVTTLS